MGVEQRFWCDHALREYPQGVPPQSLNYLLRARPGWPGYLFQPVKPVASRLERGKKPTIHLIDRAKRRRFSKLGRLQAALVPVSLIGFSAATNRADSINRTGVPLALFRKERKHSRIRFVARIDKEASNRASRARAPP